MNRRCGFTLIELLVVITIIGVLMGILFPMLSIVRRQAAATSTQSLLKRVDNALQRFQAEAGCAPYQDHASGYPTPNRLAWHLRHTMSTAESNALKSDILAAGSRYDPSAGGSMVITSSVADARETSTGPKMVHAAVANRAARNRARLALISGNTGIKGLKFTGYDFSATALVPGATSQGLAIDLLGADLESREISGTAIIDRWKQPLIYVCPVVPGARASWLPAAVGTNGIDNNQPKVPFAPEYYGLQATGRNAATSLSDSILTTASEAYRFTYELWSSGPDRATAEARNHPTARDDIGAAPYRRGIP